MDEDLEEFHTDEMDEWSNRRNYSDEVLEDQVFDHLRQLHKVAVTNDEILKACNLAEADLMGTTYLHLAVRHNSLEVVRLLLAQQNSRVNATNTNKNTPLHLVKDPEILQELIAAGCDLNAINGNQAYPIITLLRNNDVDFKVKCNMLCVLLEHGADPNNPADMTGLLFYTIINEERSINFSREEVHELLLLFLVHGADVNQKANQYYSPSIYDTVIFNEESLLMSVLHMKSNIAFELIRYGADINFCNNGTSCLSLSVCYEDSQLFNYMWSNCDKSYILCQDKFFLYKFLKRNQFGRFDFLESLYMILDSEFATDLMATSANMYYHLIRKFKQLDIEREERVKVIYTCLTKSNRVFHNDLFLVYKNYGYDEELEAFLTITMDILFHYPRTNIITRLCYPDFKPSYEIPKLMSLQELSRDAIRGCIKHIEGEAYFKYYNEVQRLNIPQRLKDIICLKIPLSTTIEDDDNSGLIC